MPEFTHREQEVIALLLLGKSNKQIALELGISLRTVEFHLTNIFNKLGVASRTEAMAMLGQADLWKTTGAENLRETAVEPPGRFAHNEGSTDWIRRLPVRTCLVTLIIVLLAFLCLFTWNFQAQRQSQAPKAAVVLKTIEAPSPTAIWTATVTTSPTAAATRTPRSTVVRAPARGEEEEYLPAARPTATLTSAPTLPAGFDPNIYLPPEPLLFGAWPATAGCPNPRGLEDFAALLPEAALNNLELMASGEDEQMLAATDPAYWPVLLNPLEGEPVDQTWIRSIARVENSSEKSIVTAQCGEETMKLSWVVEVCPGPCHANTSESLIDHYFFVARIQWLIWAIW